MREALDRPRIWAFRKDNRKRIFLWERYYILSPYAKNASSSKSRVLVQSPRPARILNKNNKPNVDAWAVKSLSKVKQRDRHEDYWTSNTSSFVTLEALQLVEKQAVSISSSRQLNRRLHCERIEREMWQRWRTW